MPTAKEFWNHRAQVYDEQVGPQYEEAYRKTAELFRKYLKPEDTVLDFACGTGIVTFAIAPSVATVQGIDISDVMVQHAQEKLAAQGAGNITFTQLDIFDASLKEESFDALLACNVLLYLEDRPAVLQRLRSLLKPNGIFLSVSDCLGEGFSRVRFKKWYEYKTGKRPYVAFDTMAGLEKAVADAGFTVLERENLFPAPPNLFLAARKN